MKTINKIESYQELKDRHSKEFGEFPIRFAFSEDQLRKALAELGAKKDDCCSIGSGGIIKKADIGLFTKMIDRHGTEQTEAFKNDDLLTEAIIYELGNHEYGYTMDSTDTINCLGLDIKNDRINRCFQSAKKQYIEANKDN